MAQALADQGILPPEKVTRSPLNNVLVSAIGGEQAEPDVSRFDIRDRRSVILLCSDGLTKHERQIASAHTALDIATELLQRLGLKTGQPVPRP